MSPGSVIAVEGASAAGKTSAVEAAAAKMGWAVVTEAFRRLTPAPTLTFGSPVELLDLEKTLLQEDARRFSEARSQARSGTTVLADTGFLGPLTYTWALAAAGAAPKSALAPLVKLARTLGHRGDWGLADAYVYIDTPASVRSDRARADPVGHPADLVSRHAAVGAVERRFYRERLAPLVGSRFRWVRGDGPVSLVAERLVGAVRAVGEPALPSASVAAVLALFLPSDGAPRPSRGNR